MDIKDLIKDLSYVNEEKIQLMIKEHGWSNTAKILGYDIIQYDNLRLAGRMAITELKRNASKTVSEYVKVFKPYFWSRIYCFIFDHCEELQRMIDEKEMTDYNCDWFSANSLIRNYLSKVKVDGPVQETPRLMRMRIAVTLHYQEGMKEIIKTFNDLCDGYYTPASRTIFNEEFIKIMEVLEVILQDYDILKYDVLECQK